MEPWQLAVARTVPTQLHPNLFDDAITHSGYEITWGDGQQLSGLRIHASQSSS